MPQTPHIEQHVTASDTVRDIVIGMSDGLTVPFALAAGLSRVVASTGVIVHGGDGRDRSGLHRYGRGWLPCGQERCGALRQRAGTGAAGAPRGAPGRGRRSQAGVRRPRPLERGERSCGGGSASAARRVGRLHDALRTGVREAQSETRSHKRPDDRGGLRGRGIHPARPLHCLSARAHRPGIFGSCHSRRVDNFRVHQRTLHGDKAGGSALQRPSSATSLRPPPSRWRVWCPKRARLEEAPCFTPASSPRTPQHGFGWKPPTFSGSGRPNSRADRSRNAGAHHGPFERPLEARAGSLRDPIRK
jgi:hypothetical protein